MALDQLVTVLNQADSLPFLFVGSGVSRRYLGHPSWWELLKWGADLTPMPVEFYAGQVNGDLPRAATLIAREFYKVWWTDDAYEDSRNKWKDICTTEASPLKIEMAKMLDAYGRTTDADLVRELELLAASQVDGVITTNYDTLLESIYPDYSVFVGQEDLLLTRSYQLAEIYKIHGSVTAPDSLVLVHEDYEQFEDFSKYLVAKLMSVFVEHPIVFLGYSLNDGNIRTILSSLVKSVRPERLSGYKDRFIFVQADASATDVEVGDHFIDLGDGRVLPVLRVRVPSFAPVLEVLASLERVLPVGLLRRVQQSVVEIVRSADPTRQIRVADIGDLNNLDGVDFVIGVGSTEALGGVKGYLGLNRHDLIVDVLADKSQYDAAEIVRTTLPEILRRTPNAWVPVHRYVRESGIAVGDLDGRVKKAMARSPESNYAVPADAHTMTPNKLVETHGLMKGLSILCQIPESAVSATRLRTLLIKHLDDLNGGDSNLGTAFGKAAVLFDRLKFREPKAEKKTVAKKPAKKKKA